MDRMLRPDGTVIIRDTPEVIDKVSRIALAVRWTTAIHEKKPESNGREKILVATKNFWKLPSTPIPLTESFGVCNNRYYLVSCHFDT
ncbi:hypothetical protein Patl1_33506 [Pistacia atlantica]|uniref:Uncharacterized protein n=1 Tax=Pistacia atlantica TaxID=434234 RepID=A0ACC0ZSK7_9ROSI|nr:hypothetical protein Patl1_33506 [Pistacia atlantica]